MSNYKFNSFGFNFDELGKVVENFVTNIKVNDIFGTAATNTVPAVNSLEHTEYLELQVAAPGLKKEDFELELEGDVLTILANVSAENESEEIKIKRKEFSYSTFKRSFCLENKFDCQNIKAKYEAGILLVTIPKKSAEEKSKIKVQVL